MTWVTLQEAAFLRGCSPRTLERQVASDQLASKLDPEGRRIVWIDREARDALPLVLAELRNLRRAVLRIQLQASRVSIPPLPDLEDDSG